MIHSDVQQLIDRYLEGSASADDEQRVTRWLDTMATDNPYPGKTLSPDQTEQLRRKLLQTIRRKTGQQKPVRLSWQRTGIAAAVISLLFAGYLTIRVLTPKPAPVYFSLHTAVGERKMMTLPDSTRIWLAPNTTLQYPEKYVDNRNIRLLSGEAYFDVTHNATKHFTVNSGVLQVEVLGTSFNIRAYDNLPGWQVAVNSGKIRVSHNDTILGVVTAGQQLQWNTDNSIATSATTTGSEPWKHDRIYFDQTPLPEVLHILENYYPVHFTLQHAQPLVISGALNTSLRAGQVIAVLEELTSHHVQFQQTTNRQYIVK